MVAVVIDVNKLLTPGELTSEFGDDEAFEKRAERSTGPTQWVGIASSRLAMPESTPHSAAVPMRRSGEKEPAGTRIGVDGRFDREQEFGRSLNLVDHGEAVERDETHPHGPRSDF